MRKSFPNIKSFSLYLHGIVVCTFIFTSSFFLNLSVEGWIVFITLIIGIDRIWGGSDPGWIFLILLTLWVITNIINIEEALSGFSNASIATIVVLFWVSKLIERLNILKFLFVPILGQSKHLSLALARFLPFIALCSAFVNNTPIVLMCVPVLEWWTIRQQISLARILMPLSFVSMIGGMCTLIGTSTNLIVQEQILELDPDAAFGFFEPAYVGFPLSIVGIVYLVVYSHFLLPDKTFQRHYIPREYAVFEYQPKKSKIPQKSFHRQMRKFMRSYPGVCWIKTIYEEENTYVFFIGISQQLENFCHDIKPFHIRYLTPAKTKSLLLNQRYFELGVTKDIDPTPKLKEELMSDQIHIFVINRKGKILQDLQSDHVESSSDVEKSNVVRNLLIPHSIQEGDILTVEAEYTIYKNNNNYFSHIRELPLFKSTSVDSKESPTWIGYLLYQPKVPLSSSWKNTLEKIILSLCACTGLLTIAILAALKVAPLSAMAFIFFLGLSCLFRPQKENLSPWKVVLGESNWSLFLILASSIGIGKGLVVSGVSKEIATQVSNVFLDLGIYITLAGLFCLTVVMTSFISNAAVVSFMIPIAHNISLETKFDSKPLYLCIMIAASSAFMTNLGYQTNLIVQESTGYRSWDFLKFGTGICFLSLVVTTSMIMVIYVL